MELPEEEYRTQMWKTVVYDKADIIDPNYTHDWRSMAMGFALGTGYTIDMAEQFVNTLQRKGLI